MTTTNISAINVDATGNIKWQIKGVNDKCEEDKIQAQTSCHILEHIKY